ncbi:MULTISPECIES: hypothetical protein [Paenibacillus]|nr:hypothetical protein [Paenibacillus caseinilyticus]MCZ8522521.1 hypothetical protein [Paenibacillus caseinilyticus]
MSRDGPHVNNVSASTLEAALASGAYLHTCAPNQLKVVKAALESADLLYR